MNLNQFSTRNYEVPAVGGTHVVTSSGTASSTPQFFGFTNLQFAGISFLPQGAWIDNTLGTAPLVITIQQINFVITVPAGALQAVQFPAVTGFSASVTGTGNFKIFWTDFPLLPSAGVVTIAGGTVDATITNTPNVAVPASPGGGAGYLSTLTPSGATPLSAVLTTGTTVSVAPPANSNLRKLSVQLSANAIDAAAGLVTLTAVLGGVTVYTRAVYVPTAQTSAVDLVNDVLDFDGVAVNAGAAGDLVFTVSTALTGGQWTFNAWFD